MEERDKTKKERKIEYNRAYRKDNREHLAGYAKTWRTSNPEYQKKWREVHPGYDKEWSATHPGYGKHRAEYHGKWREANGERINELKKNYLLTLAEQNPDGYVADKGLCGENHPNWKGGVSPYPNPMELHVNRLIVLNDAGWKCAVCGGEADRAHHIDGSKDSHDIGNLLPVCQGCHLREFHAEAMGRPRGSRKIISNKSTAGLPEEAYA